MPSLSKKIWGFTFLCFLLETSCISLGIWQIYRFHEKKNLENLLAFSQKKNILREDTPKAVFQRVKIEGIFDHSRERHLLSRTCQGKAGTHIITPLLLKNNKVLWVDRGWVPLGSLSPIRRPSSRLKVEGLLLPFTKKRFFTPENDPSQGSWYYLVPSPDSFQNFYLAATYEGDKPALPREPISQFLRNNHINYAITWFSLAVVLIFLYGSWLYKNLRQKSNLNV